jgi:hypothetical protein
LQERERKRKRKGAREKYNERETLIGGKPLLSVYITNLVLS